MMSMSSRTLVSADQTEDDGGAQSGRELSEVEYVDRENIFSLCTRFARLCVTNDIAVPIGGAEIDEGKISHGIVFVQFLFRPRGEDLVRTVSDTDQVIDVGHQTESKLLKS